MTRSANEVMVLAGKAARGAGAPPAQAAQFGAAAVWHLQQGRDVAALDAALAALPAGPILDLPLAIARIVERGEGASVLPPAPLAQSYVETLPFVARMDAQGRVEIDLTTPAPRKVPQRIALDPQTYAAWSALAAKLLVPESDASRLSGAGAGLTDND